MFNSPIKSKKYKIYDVHCTYNNFYVKLLSYKENSVSPFSLVGFLLIFNRIDNSDIIYKSLELEPIDIDLPIVFIDKDLLLSEKYIDKSEVIYSFICDFFYTKIYLINNTDEGNKSDLEILLKINSICTNKYSKENLLGLYAVAFNYSNDIILELIKKYKELHNNLELSLKNDNLKVIQTLTDRLNDSVKRVHLTLTKLENIL
jgi:hypothetical protein